MRKLNLLIFLVLIINIFYRMDAILIFLTIINLMMQVVFIIAVRRRNKHYKQAAILLWIYQKQLKKYDELLQDENLD